MFLFVAPYAVRRIAKDSSLYCQTEVQMSVVLKSQDLPYASINKIT